MSRDLKGALRLPLKQKWALGAGLGERRGTWLDRREDTSAANLRGWEGEMVMEAETLQNSSDEINSTWAESSELYFGS